MAPRSSAFAVAAAASIATAQHRWERYEGYLKLDEEIAHLKKRLKKRKMNVARRNKRDHKVKARNLADRIDHERELNPKAGEFFEDED